MFGHHLAPQKEGATVCVLGSKLLVLGMGNLQPLIGNPYNGALKTPMELG